jgi:DoxX-like family
MKAKNIAYWTTTVLVAFFIGSGGVAQMAQFHTNPRGVVPVLGYPMYFFAILGFWKVLGAIAILVPRFPRLKEWAYAGIFFDLTGAAASCVAVGGYGVYAFHVIAPLVIAGLTVASWALRPQSRVVGVLFPASSSRPVQTRVQ